MKCAGAAAWLQHFPAVYQHNLAVCFSNHIHRKREETAAIATTSPCVSRLSQWPVQIKLVPVHPYKEVFTLRVFGELSFRQIASLFGKTENWAAVTFHRAKQKIMHAIQNN